MKRQLSIIFGCALLSSAAFGQDKGFKDELEKVAYAVGLNSGNALSNSLHMMNVPLRAEAVEGFKDALKGTTAEKLSYANGIAAGLNLSNGLKRVEADINIDMIIKGFNDAIKGGAPALTQDEIKTVLTKFQQELSAKAREKQRIQAEKQAELDKVEGVKNREIGKAFLDENAKKPGVKTMPSGLQYKVLTSGKGESPKGNDTVTVNYRGTFIDGTEFDSTTKKGTPLVMPINQFVQGWVEALQMMKPGDKWQLFVPADLGYKDVRKPGPVPIPPGSTLLFEMELIKFEATQAPPQPQQLTSDIIKVPSAEELKKGAKIETLKPEDVEREKAKEQQKPKK